MGWIPPLGSIAKVTSANLETISDEIGGWFARKTGDQQITNNTLTNDTELVVPVVANAVYVVTGLIIYNGLAAAQIKFGWSVPAGATLSWNPGALDSSVTAAFAGIIGRAWYNSGSTPTLGIDGTAQNVVATPNGLLVVGANAGNLQFKWAQATTNATATTVKTDSYLALVRVA